MRKKRRRCALQRLRDSSDPFQLSEAEFTKNVRLNRVLARQVIADLQPHDAQRTSLPFIVRILATLHFFGHGSYQKCVGNNCNFPMSQPSISRSLRYIAKLIVKVKSAEISFPNSAEEENTTKIGFFKQFDIKSVIGAIDCTYIPIIAPPSNNPERPLNLYMNRKGFCSINAEAVCDYNNNFVTTLVNFKSFLFINVSTEYQPNFYLIKTLTKYLDKKFIKNSQNRAVNINNK